MAVFKVDVCWDDAPTLDTAVKRMLDLAKEIVEQLTYSCMPEPTMRSELPQLATWVIEDLFRQVTWQAEPPVEIGVVGADGVTCDPETWSYVRFEGPRDALEGLARVTAVWDASDGQPSDEDINHWISTIQEDSDESPREPARYTPTHSDPQLSPELIEKIREQRAHPERNVPRPPRNPARYESLECEGGVHKNCRDHRCYCDCHLDKDGGAAVSGAR